MKKLLTFKAFKLFLVIAVLSVMLFGFVTQAQEVKPSPYVIKLLSRSFIPEPGIEKELTRTLEITERAKVYVIIQFSKVLSLEQHEFLNKSGILLQEYLGNTTYAASIPKETLLDSGNLKEIVRWAGLFDPKDKLKYALSEKQFYEWAIDKESGKIKLLVQFFPDVNKETVIEDLASLELEGKRHGADNSWAVLVDHDQIEQLAALNSVKMIQQGPIPFLPLNAGGRRVANSNEAQQSTYNTPQPAFNKVSGGGIRIGICDSGIDENHQDFDQITAAGNAGASRVYNQRPGSGSHGTHVASIAAGNGFNSVNNGLPAFSLRGHAPEAEVGDYPSFGSNAQLYHDAIVNDGTDVTNHSYVQSYTVYDAEASSLDEIIRGDAIDNNNNPIPARPQVWAAGNNGDTAQYGNEEGYYAVFTSAKNTISVGGVDTIDGRLYKRTSLGPTFDGRIKPDIVAPACTDRIATPSVGIQAASSGTQGYTGKCGTSMAAPVVSGIIALMMEQFQDTYGNLPDFPSTYKAMLIHTARDMVKTEAFNTREFDNPDTGDPVLYHAGPDFATGYGLVDAETARDIVTKSAQWKEATINSTGDSDTWCISVPEGSKELKVVIAWDDEPGSTTTAEDVSKLVNDLDLKLIDPDGNKYLPWTIDPLPLTATPGDGAPDPIQSGDVDPAYRGADHRNNVEMVNVCLPKVGTWKAVVRGFNLPSGNAQSYSLVSSHRILFWCIMVDTWHICERYPWICDPIYEIPPIRRIDDTWFIDPGQLIPIDEICKYVIDCPGCDGPGWSYCPGWTMNLHQLPQDAVVSLINQNGKILVEDKTDATSRILQLKRQRPGEQYFLLITDSKGNSYPKNLWLELKLEIW